ncbi:MAG: hypothetical protein WBB82_09860, partial [Limnothrix sp.]
MIRLNEIKLPLDHKPEAIAEAICTKLNLNPHELLEYTIFKRSFDARKKRNIFLVYIVDIKTHKDKSLLKTFRQDPHVIPTPEMDYKMVGHAPDNFDFGDRPIVIGLGPCGMFAGLMLARMGFRPIILERGKQVDERTKDTFAFWKKRGEFNPESNAQFGEGGAGTFSDGKLYSQVRDRHHYKRKVLEEFVEAGANSEILYIAKPHIGTFKLVGVVKKIRATIESLGGEIRFQSKVKTVEIEDRKVKGVTLENGDFIPSTHVVMAMGHSARDTFEMLHKQGVYIEPKPFSIGFRIEHPQPLIDECRYGEFAGNKVLGAADYNLVHHCKNG